MPSSTTTLEWGDCDKAVAEVAVAEAAVADRAVQREDGAVSVGSGTAVAGGAAGLCGAVVPRPGRAATPVIGRHRSW